MNGIAERHAAKRDGAFKRQRVQERILDEVAAERRRQDELHPDKNCSIPYVSSGYKGFVLVEEVGEVAKEAMICMDTPREHPDHIAARAKLKTELIQVAATAVAWVESLEGN